MTTDSTSSQSLSTPYRITTDYKGPKLSQSKGNFREWDQEINIYLRLNGLSRFMAEDPNKPSNPNSSDLWQWADGDSLTTAIIYNAVDSEERDELSFSKLAHENLAILKNRHQKQGVARQAAYLQAALNSRFDTNTSLTLTAKKIREDIKNAFACADLSEDLLTCICILNSLTDEKFAHIRSNIALRFSSSTREHPDNYDSIFSYLDNEQPSRVSDRSQ